MKNRLRVPILLLSSLLITSCGSTSATRPNTVLATDIPVVEADPTSTHSPTPSEQRYFNDEGHMSLILPEEWSVVGPTAVSLKGGISYNLYVLGVQPEASGGPGNSRLIIADASLISIEEFLTSQCSTCPEAPIDSILLGDIEVKTTVVGGGGVPFEVTWIFAEHEGKLIGLSIHEPETLEPLTGVLESLKLE